ncbi:MAG: porin family protein [Bacteroidota bacterium]
MSKYILIICLSFLSIFSANGQFKLGIQFSPTLSTNRIEANSDSLNLDTDGTGLRMAFGPIIDYQIKDNYYFSSGLLFVSKRVGIESTRVDRSGLPNRETYSLQYLQIPVSLKLFTNEVSIDKKFYVQLGTTLEFAIDEKSKEDENFLIEDFALFDSSLLLGFGLEYRLGVNTTLFGGFSYHRGLANVVSEQVALDTDITMKNDYLGLDLGIKF